MQYVLFSLVYVLLVVSLETRFERDERKRRKLD